MSERMGDVALSKHIRLRDVSRDQDPFCIYPFKHLEATREGRLDFCCKFEQLPTADDGTPATLARHSPGEFWNSSHMRSIRRDMVEGRLVSGCQGCYDRERAGDQSDRVQGNEMWRDGWLNEGHLTIDELKAAASRRDFVASGPEYVELRLGNLCNLKCRMCYGDTSSAIAADPVHSMWSGTRAYRAEDCWWRDRSALDRIFESAEQVRQLYLLGGEPFLIKEVGYVLDYLIQRGVAEQIVLEFATNGTVRPRWLDLTRRFKQVRINFSIDGYGALNGYLRYPCDWGTLVANIGYFRALPNAVVGYSTVVQAYNALSLVDLFKFCESIELPPGSVYPLVHPEHLSIRVLPPAARSLAAERLREYAQSCPDTHRAFMRALAAGLARSQVGDNDDEMRQLFMLFTSELDASRGQAFRDVCPELHAFMREAGLIGRFESHVREPVLPLRIDVGQRPARLWMRRGWCQDESLQGETFVWSAGERSFLKVALPTNEDVRVTVDCMPFAFPDCSQQVMSVFVNSRQTACVVMESQRRSYSFVVRRDLLERGGNTLEFRYAYARAPSAVLPGSTDSREIAVCWYAIEFDTALNPACSAVHLR